MAAFAVEIARRFEEAEPAIAALAADGHATPFQTPLWLRCWFATIGAARTAEPVIVIVRRGDRAQPCLVLPLVRNRAGGLAILEGADFGFSDYNAPLIGRGERFTPVEVTSLWRAIRRALPPADLFRIVRMPSEIEGAANPLANIRSAGVSPYHINLLNIEDGWSAYTARLDGRVRRELERSSRVFEAANGRFELIDDAGEALRIFEEMERRQSARMLGLGNEYHLDRPEARAFYRALIAQGLGGGQVRIGALRADGEFVAAVFGVTRGPLIAILRIATGDARWKNCSPGRLAFLKTMEALHAQGFTGFDFTIGNYDYKRRLGVEMIPMRTIVEAQSLRGTPVGLRERLHMHMLGSPRLRRLHARVRGLPAVAS